MNCLILNETIYLETLLLAQKSYCIMEVSMKPIETKIIPHIC